MISVSKLSHFTYFITYLIFYSMKVYNALESAFLNYKCLIYYNLLKTLIM